MPYPMVVTPSRIPSLPPESLGRTASTTASVAQALSSMFPKPTVRIQVALVSALAEEWHIQDERGRNALETRFRAYFPELIE